MAKIRTNQPSLIQTVIDGKGRDALASSWEAVYNPHQRLGELSFTEGHDYSKSITTVYHYSTAMFSIFKASETLADKLPLADDGNPFTHIIAPLSLGWQSMTDKSGVARIVSGWLMGDSSVNLYGVRGRKEIHRFTGYWDIYSDNPKARNDLNKDIYDMVVPRELYTVTVK